MPPILFLDVASKTGLAAGVPGTTPVLATKQLRLPKEEIEDSFGRANRWTNEIIDQYGPMCVYVEAPLHPGGKYGSTNSTTTTTLVGLWAVVVGVARARGIVVQSVAVRTVRKYFLGRGDLKGEFAKKEALRIATALGWSPQNTDEADAAAGYYWASQYYVDRWKPPSTHWLDDIGV